MKQQLKSILVATVRCGGRVGGRGYARRVNRLVAEALGLVDRSVETVDVAGHRLRFVCMNDFSRWRVATFFDKEPETLAWIDGFDAGDTFWDIGANIGQYALYAAARGASVLAFEPSAANYFVLNANIRESSLDGRVTAYCLALNDAGVAGVLGMTTTEFGGALSQFAGPESGPADGVVFRQGMIGMTIDDFVANYGAAFPNHIKVDVDGNELKIVVGAERTLSDPRLKSMSIELDDADADLVSAVTSAVGRAGLELAAKAHAPMFDDSAYKTLFNYQFRRP